jgi:hypothetical protein
LDKVLQEDKRGVLEDRILTWNIKAPAGVINEIDIKMDAEFGPCIILIVCNV